MPLVSCIKNSLICCYYASVPVVKISKKIVVIWKIEKKARVNLLRDLTKKSVNFSALMTFDIRLLVCFGEEDEISPIGEKKFLITEEKLGKMTTF